MKALKAVTCVVGLLALAGCASNPVTVGGVPTTSDTIHKAANTIYELETWLVVTGETLLDLRVRDKIDDESWNEIANVSWRIKFLLDASRDALLAYARVDSQDNLETLNKTLIAVQEAAVLLAGLAEEWT